MAGVEDFFKPVRSLLAVEVDLKGARLVLPHVFLLVVTAEDIQLQVAQVDPVLVLAREPRRRLGLMGHYRIRGLSVVVCFEVWYHTKTRTTG